jgi:flagellar hook-associated protein 3 FlgL
MPIRLDPDLLPGLLTAIQQSEQNMNTATQQLSTGLSVNEPSDNPAAVAALIGNHNQAGQDDQYLQNISTLQGRLQVSDSTLSQVVTALTQALSVGTEGANGTLSAADRQAVAAQVQGLTSQLLSLANTNYQGTYLFSGTAVNTQPFTLNTATNGVTYNGNTGTTSVQISNGSSINTSLPGSQLFTNAAGSAFGALQDLYSSLVSGNNIGTAVNEVSSAISQVGVQRVFYGNALNQINSTENFLNQDTINLSSQANALVGVNPATAATNLSQAQVANQAVISATGRILSLPTLLDFLQPLP